MQNYNGCFALLLLFEYNLSRINCIYTLRNKSNSKSKFNADKMGTGRHLTG
jgi:hypothetical protein